MFNFAAQIGADAQIYSQQQSELRLTVSVRAQPIWSDFEITWENMNTRLLEVSLQWWIYAIRHLVQRKV
ncbi:MAG: hypothetical protein CM1200mP39_06520 [Dehalococcoidia bacterium]|nr:MAG: hypothetical protein CM1200mP39_06520 [Dehalococcoidia bacterium]